MNVTHGFGISREGRKLAVMMSETTILYSLGRKIVVHDLEHNKQRAIDVGGKVRAVTSLQVCPRKRYLAISEMPNATGSPPQVSIIDLEAEKPKRLRTLVHVNENAEVVVTGSKYVDVRCAEPVQHGQSARDASPTEELPGCDKKAATRLEPNNFGDEFHGARRWGFPLF